MDGADKEKFYIFDFCGNFEFFRMSQGKPTPTTMSVQSAIFKLKTQMIYKLQDLTYQTEDLSAFRATLVDELVGQVNQLNRDNFAVRQHLRYIVQYNSAEGFLSLSYEDTLTIESELAPLILPEQDEPKAIRFDALMYGIELAFLMGENNKRGKRDLLGRVRGIANVANVPEIMAKSALIDQLLNTNYLETAGINEFEHIRQQLRYLMKYLKDSSHRYDTDFADDILAIQWNTSELENDDLKNYKAKAEYYIREHQDEEVIAKLKSNIPLTRDDMTALERILWSQVGTREDYEAECGEKPLGEFVREIVGLDMNAAKEAFATYLNESNLNSRQIYFVNQIVEYIVHNGMMKDLSVLQSAPFTDRGSITDIFTDLPLWAEIKAAIGRINANAAA